MGSYPVIGNGRIIIATLTGLAVGLAALQGAGAAPVGVTSGADGDPLGKPPNANERVLRIGIDVQANELVTTNANDRAHLVFLDGSALTVGPNAQLTIDKFVYDPSTQKGELAISAGKGVLRLVGGKISKNTPVVITTPAATIGIRGGISIVSVAQVQTVANFIFGNSMTVTAGGQTQTATRAGSQVVTNAGNVPGAAILLKPGALTAMLGQLEGTNSSGSKGADQSAQTSGFSNKNSGQPAVTPGLNQNPPPNPTNNTLTNALSNSNPASDPLGKVTPQNVPTPQNIATLQTIIPDQNTPANNNPPVNNTPPNTDPVTNNPPPTPTTPRTSQTLTGFSAGVFVTSNGDSNNSYYGGSSDRVRLLKPGTISITTDATNNTAQTTIVVKGLDGSRYDRQPSTATLAVGSQHSTFADDKNYVAYKLPTDTSPQSTFKNGYRPARPINDTTAVASVPAAPGCACEYLTWGWWASSIPDPNHPGRSYEAVGTYVAGKLPTVQLPTTGSATYSGFMAGMAQQGSNAAYAAAGTYQNVWNFQRRNGAFSGTFDGRSYSGLTYATGRSGSPTFSGNFYGGYRSGTLNGSFFASPTDQAKYQAGTFAIGGNNSYYRASGIFAGQR